MSPSQPLAAITGASSGIGAAFARALAARGFHLILIARRTPRLEALAAELAQRHAAKSEIVTADLQDPADLERVAGRLHALPQLDLLVNNAGYGVPGQFASSDYAGQEGMHRLHVIATLRLTHAVLGGMVARRSGAIVQVASVAGFLSSPGHASYGASKSWIVTFTDVLSLELRGSGSPVKVQALCPGYTYSEFHDRLNVDRYRLAPKAWWFSAEQVVEESLAGLERGRTIVIPGLRYRLLVGFMMRLPRPLRRAIVLAAARHIGRMPAR